MQDRTINNALIALRKHGGHQGKLAEVLLDMRGVKYGGWVQETSLRRGQGQQFVLMAVREGPKTRQELIELFRSQRPDISPEAAGNRADQALQRLKAKGLVKRGDGVWLAP